MDLTGYREIARTSAWIVLTDESGLGQIVHQLPTPGPGGSMYVPVNTPQAKWAWFAYRTDMVKGTTIFCPDVGVDGSTWRWDGTYWGLVSPCHMARVQSSAATQLLVIGTETNGFVGYGPGLTLPLGLFTKPGRRFQVRGSIVRGSGTLTAPSTELRIDSTSLNKVAWDTSMREHRFAFDFWTPDALSVAAGCAANVITHTSSSYEGQVVVAGSPLIADSAAIATLATAAHTLSIGISDTAADSARFGLVDLDIQLLA